MTEESAVSQHGFLYQACFCEENVYLMGASLSAGCPHATGPFSVLFISNHDKRVLILHQTAGDGRFDDYVIWDYHVILMKEAIDSSPALIFDLDTRLPIPCAASDYLTSCFPRGIDSDLKPLFRRIPLEAFLCHFRSDRRHMRRPDGSWLSPPPPWPVIDVRQGIRSTVITLSEEATPASDIRNTVESSKDTVACSMETVASSSDTIATSVKKSEKSEDNETVHNLEEFISMREDSQATPFSVVLTLEELLASL